MAARRVLAAATAGAVGSAFGTSYLVSQKVVYPGWMRRGEDGELPSLSKRHAEEMYMGKFTDPLTDWQREFKTVHFPGDPADRGWYIASPTGKSNRCVVAVHGAGNDRREALRQVKGLQEATGANVLLFDCSDHGKGSSTSRGISFGVREHEDVAKAVRAAVDEGNQDVFVLGTSQGAASSILAAARHPELPIRGLILENPFADANEVILFGLRKAFGKVDVNDPVVQTELQRARADPVLSALLASQSLIPESYLGAIAGLVRYRTGLKESDSPLSNMPNVKVPVLFMHGTDDKLVPVDHTQRLRAACGAPGVQEWYPKAQHSRLFNSHPAEWVSRVGQFVNATAAAA
ncbi:hypothetical protein DIPPA_22919 [Diplonema papillatum]|nr:hypothetical protein DIPPA_22919 [Diplonema papillatum]|eukprot:gene9387-14554_t